MKAFGAEVIVCPTNVDPEDPRSYYSVSSRLEKEVPNAGRRTSTTTRRTPQAHYEQTGPEIWDQTDGKVTHLVVGVGTGGTVSGVGRYLKERNPAIKVWGIDTYGSVFKKYKETGIFDKSEIYPYITEGIGEDFLPQNVDFSVIDHFEKVTDRDAAIMTRRIAREEGIFAGNSAGSAMAGLLQLKDHFTRDDRHRRHLPRPRVALPRRRCSTTSGCARRGSSSRAACARADLVALGPLRRAAARSRRRSRSRPPSA